MVRRLFVALFVLAVMALPLAAQPVAFNSGDAGLDSALKSLNAKASADLGSFTAQLSAEFGVKPLQIQTWMKAERLQPAEIYLMLELSRISHKPPAAVLQIYKKNRGKGWGVVAQSLGIKPGSKEFRLLKTSATQRNQKLKVKKQQ